MRKTFLLAVAMTLLAIAAYSLGGRNRAIAYAGFPSHEDAAYPALSRGSVPQSYGRLAAVIPDQIGTGLIFEDAEGVIRFVSMTGMKEGELARYEGTAPHGGIPKSYGHLVSAVVNPNGTALVFEDSTGVIRFVTLAGKEEGELIRN
jgi:hypothetical protein